MTYTEFLEIITDDWTTSTLLTPKFDLNSGTPKYKQLAFAIAAAMQNDTIKKGELMPSIANYALVNNISTTTVIKTYKLLKNQGLIQTGKARRYWVTGKGNFALLTN